MQKPKVTKKIRKCCKCPHFRPRIQDTFGVSFNSCEHPDGSGIMMDDSDLSEIPEGCPLTKGPTLVVLDKAAYRASQIAREKRRKADEAEQRYLDRTYKRDFYRLY